MSGRVLPEQHSSSSYPRMESTDYSDTSSTHNYTSDKNEERGASGTTLGRYESLRGAPSQLSPFKQPGRRMNNWACVCSFIAGLTGCLTLFCILISITQYGIDVSLNYNSLQVLGMNTMQLPMDDEALFDTWKDCGNNTQEARAKGCFYDSRYSPSFFFSLRDYSGRVVGYHFFRNVLN